MLSVYTVCGLAVADTTILFWPLHGFLYIILTRYCVPNVLECSDRLLTHEANKKICFICRCFICRWENVADIFRWQKKSPRYADYFFVQLFFLLPVLADIIFTDDGQSFPIPIPVRVNKTDQEWKRKIYT